MVQSIEMRALASFASFDEGDMPSVSRTSTMAQTMLIAIEHFVARTV